MSFFGKSMTNQTGNEDSFNITIALVEITTHLIQVTNDLSERQEKSEEVTKRVTDN